MRRPDHAIRTAILALLGLVIAGFAAFAPGASAASYSTSSYASRLLSLVNGARADHGLPALRLASGTTTVAAGWTAHMSSAGALSHNPDLRHQIESHGSPDWTTYGENVGHGAAADPDSLFRAYMQSPEHRANILTGDYRYVGVAVVFDGPSSWNTFDFVDTYGTPAPAPQQPTHHKAVHRTHTAKPQTRPATSPAPVAAPQPAPQPAIHHAAPRHHDAAGHQATTRHHEARHHDTAKQHVRVQGLHAQMPKTPLMREVVVAAPTAATPLSPLPTNRSSRVVLVGLAVLLLSAAARRWTLTVAAA